MTQNTFSDTASIGEDFIEHYGVKGMQWGVRKKDKEPKREYNKVVSTNEDGSKEIYVGGVGTAGRLLDDEEQKRADELAELLPQLDSDYEKTKSEYENLYSEYEKLDEASKTLSENDPKYEAAASKAWEAWERSSEVRKKRDRLSTERVKYRTELSELHSKAMALEKKERETNPGSGRRVVVMPEPGKTTYTSRSDPAGVDDARFKKVKHFDDSEYLEHYGVKGMKWGVRRDLKKLPTKKAREAYVAEKDAKWRAKTENPKKAIRAARRASRDATRMTRKLNKKYKDMGYKLKGNSLRKNNINNRKNRLVRNQYDIELKGVIESSLDSAAYKVYKNSPSRLYQVNLSRDLDGTVSAKITPRQNAKLDKQRASITNKARKMKHSDEGTQDLYVKMEEDEDGFVVDIQLPEFDLEFAEDEVALDHSDLSDLGSGFIQHYGVKGMKWGVRKNKDGKVKSVVKRTPFRGVDESGSNGAVQSIRKQNDPQLEASLKRVKQTYKTSTQSINQGLRNINKLYEGVDLNTAPKKVKDGYYEEVNRNINEKLTANTILNSRPKDRLVPLFDYDVKKGGPPEVSFASNHGFSSGAARAAATRTRDADMNTLDHGKRLTKRIAKRMALVYVTGGLVRSGFDFGEGVNAGLDEYERMRHDGMSDAKLPRLDVAFDIDVDEFGKVTNVKFEVLSKDVNHSDLSELGSDFLQHHGVKGMKWGVRKDGKPRGYQGPSSTKKKVKKAVSNVVDPDKRAKRKLQKAKAKYERQRLNEQASGYEKATEESKKNSRENEKASDPKPKSKPVAELSDDELRRVIQRIDLEKRYATLMEERRPKSKAEKVNKFIKKAATEAAENAAKQLITKGVGAAVTRATGVPINGANAKAATNALKTAANDATKDITKAAQNQAAAQPKAPSEPTPKGNDATNSPKAPRTPFTRAPLAPIKSKNVFNTASPTKSPSFSDILSKSYNDTITSGTTQRGTSWLDEFDTNRDFVTLNQERRKRR